MKLLSTSNSKLRKDGIKSFGLPAGKTCPFAGACKKFCYAQKGCFRFPSVAKAQGARFKVSQSDAFIASIGKELKRTKMVRIHDSGDFYNAVYRDKWLAIARENPSVKFYCYTKSIAYFKGLPLPENFRVIFSLGSKQDNLIDLENDRHARIFNSKAELLAAGYVDSSESDLVAATTESKKIGLILH